MNAVLESATRFPGAPMPPADLSRVAAIRVLSGIPEAVIASLTGGDALRLQLLTELAAIAYATGQIDGLRAARS